jgi:hypothetical protein
MDFKDALKPPEPPTNFEGPEKIAMISFNCR